MRRGQSPLSFGGQGRYTRISSTGDQAMAEDGINSFMTGPDETGRFGIFGGRFVSETLIMKSHRKPKPARRISTALLHAFEVVMRPSCPAIVERM